MKPTFLSRFFSALNELSNADLAKRAGLHEVAQRLLFHGTKAGVRAGETARSTIKEFQSRFKSGKELQRGEELQRATAGSHPFDLTLTEEQEMTREMLQRFALDVMRPLAEASESDDWDPSGFLQEVHELGLGLIAIPEALEGAGGHRSPSNHALVAEALAYGDMGLALVALSSLGFINALTEFGTHAQQARFLPSFTGETPVVASLATMEARVGFSPNALQTRAVRDGQGFRLNGVKSMVPLCEQAEIFLVLAQLEGQGPRAFLVESGVDGVTQETVRHMGLNNAKMGHLTLDDVWVEDEALLGEDEALYDHSRFIDLGRIATCALAVGTGQAVVDYVIPYCNERIAFGEPISHRQAVAFTIADLAIELEGMRLLTWRAASRAELGKEYHRETSLARLLCAEKSMYLGSNGVQLLGGHGFITDHPVERWYRQLRAVSLLEAATIV